MTLRETPATSGAGGDCYVRLLALGHVDLFLKAASSPTISLRSSR